MNTSKGSIFDSFEVSPTSIFDVLRSFLYWKKPQKQFPRINILQYVDIIYSYNASRLYPKLHCQLQPIQANLKKRVKLREKTQY